MESTQSLQRKASQSTLSVQTEPKHEPASTATPLLESSDATLAPQGWPTSPSRIKHPLFPALLDGAFDIALFAFSSCFLVFSLVVMSYDGAPTSENPRVIRILTRATGYGPTVFPLLFAAVVGRATHAILLWRLEKGERIQILDTLATSTSLTSTVISQIQLRQISALSTLLVVIWALSPIGGQASLRQISIGTAMQPSDQTFRYAVPFRSGVQAGYPTSLFIRAIYAPLEIKVSPVDLWGNVKIPNIEHYEKITEPDGNGWFTTDTSDDHMAVYVSFVGIPVDVVQNNTTPADYNFQLQTEYLQLTCVPVNYTRIHWGMEMELPPGSENATASDSVFSWSQSDREERKTYALETLKPFSFSYSRRFLGTEGTSCSVESRYVEVEVSCAVHSTCRATKVRRSQLPHLPYASTIMDFSPDNFIREFLWSIGGYDKIVTGLPPNEPSILDSYLSDPSLTSTPHAVFRNRTTVIASTINISDEAWSARFGHLLNSYWACQYSLYTLVDGIDNAPTDPSKDNITFMPPLDDEFVGNYSVLSFNWTSDDFRESKVWSSEGQKTEYIEVIKAHKPWAITLSIASLILIVFSFVPPLVRHFLTTGPDIAINFSSLATRNNSYVPIPASGSYLPAAYRFRLLKDPRLRLADADGKSDVGNLVIAAQGVEKAKYSRVRKGRVYE